MKTPKFIQITSSATRLSNRIYGLTVDGQVYVWADGSWVLLENKEGYR